MRFAIYRVSEWNLWTKLTAQKAITYKKRKQTNKHTIVKPRNFSFYSKTKIITRIIITINRFSNGYYYKMAERIVLIKTSLFVFDSIEWKNRINVNYVDDRRSWAI